MIEDGLTLTTYFGERDRAGGRLLAEALFDLYAEHGVRASVLLRGAEGYGRLAQARSDRLLSLSEDLPAIALAVDVRERIEALLPAVLAFEQRGVVTLERAHLLSGSADGASLPAGLDGAVKLTVAVGRRERAAGRPAFVAVCDLLRRGGIAGASVFLGVDGTRAGRRIRAAFLGVNREVPMLIVAVGAGERIRAVLAELSGLLADPLVTVEPVRICKRDGELIETPHALLGHDEYGLERWQRLTVYSTPAVTHGGVPLHSEIVRRLRAADAAGATTIRGVWGYHGEHAPQGDRFFQVRRHVPVATITIDTPEQTARSFAIIDELTAEHGLVTSETVPALRATSASERRGGLRPAGPDR